MRDSRHHSNPTAERSGLFHAPRRSALASLVLGAALTVCGAGAPSLVAAQSAGASEAPVASEQPLPSSAPTFPLTLTDDEGTSISLPAEPQRIVSLSPSNTEIAFAIGAGDRLVGGTDADDYPAEAAALPDVVVQTKVQKEQIVSLNPDLILANGNGLTPQADIDQLRQLGFPVMVLTASSLDGVERDIDLIGEAVGDFDAATSTVATVQSQIQDIQAAVAPVQGVPRTFYEIGYGPDIYAPPADSAYADLIRLAKGDPVSGDESYVIPLEKLVQADPQVILLGDAAYGTCPADVAARSGWQDITAVKDGAVRPVNDLVITRPGPRMPLGLVSLVRAIHPEITLSDFPAEPALCAAAGSPEPSGSAAP
jgi:iron complex transport system substrate-binding protein